MLRRDGMPRDSVRDVRVTRPSGSTFTKGNNRLAPTPVPTDFDRRHSGFYGTNSALPQRGFRPQAPSAATKRARLVEAREIVCPGCGCAKPNNCPTACFCY